MKPTMSSRMKMLSTVSPIALCCAFSQSMITRVIIDWLKAQHKAMGDTVESIFILDDIVGFINEEHYLEFAHPYLKRICDAFPPDWIKLYHNDAEMDACLDHLPDAGFNVLNWGKQKHIS